MSPSQKMDGSSRPRVKLVHQRYRARATGALKASATWYLEFSAPGRGQVREPTGTADRKVAEQLRAKREAQLTLGQDIDARADKVTFDELAEGLLNDYRVNRLRSLDRVEDALAHLGLRFGGWRARAITAAQILKYVAARQAADPAPANATINRELAALKRMFRLGQRTWTGLLVPHIHLLREHNVRTGFFEREAFDAVHRHLPPYAQPVALFAYVTGWRLRSEVLPLRWSQVDLTAGIVRLEPGTTKAREGRTFVLPPVLRACLDGQRAITDALQREHSCIIPWVFHRTVTSRRRQTIQPGVPIKGFRRAWRTACRAAGVPGAIPHDFRRSAIRNMVRAHVPERVAMTMSGHKTRSVFERYNIVSEGDLREAAGRLAEFYGAEGPAAPSTPQLVRAGRRDAR
jgi:integrase